MTEPDEDVKLLDNFDNNEASTDKPQMAEPQQDVQGSSGNVVAAATPPQDDEVNISNVPEDVENISHVPGDVDNISPVPEDVVGVSQETNPPKDVENASDIFEDVAGVAHKTGVPKDVENRSDVLGLAEDTPQMTEQLPLDMQEGSRQDLGTVASDGGERENVDKVTVVSTSRDGVNEKQEKQREKIDKETDKDEDARPRKRPKMKFGELPEDDRFVAKETIEAVAKYIQFIIESALVIRKSDDHPVFEPDEKQVEPEPKVAKTSKSSLEFQADEKQVEPEPKVAKTSNSSLEFQADEKQVDPEPEVAAKSNRSLIFQAEENQVDLAFESEDQFPDITATQTEQSPRSSFVNTNDINDTNEQTADSTTTEPRKKRRRPKEIKPKESVTLPPIMQLRRPATYEAAKSREAYVPLPPVAHMPQYPRKPLPRKWGVPLTPVEQRTVLVGFACPPVHKFSVDQLMTNSASTLTHYYSCKPCIKSIEWVKLTGRHKEP